MSDLFRLIAFTCASIAMAACQPQSMASENQSLPKLIEGLATENGFVVDAGLPIAVETDRTRKVTAHGVAALEPLRSALKTPINDIQVAWIAFCLRVLQDKASKEDVSQRLRAMESKRASIESRFAIYEMRAYLRSVESKPTPARP